MLKILRSSMTAVVLATGFSAVAAEERGSGPGVERPAPATGERSRRPPPKATPKPPKKPQKPAARTAAPDQKPTTKPCEEVKPCAID